MTNHKISHANIDITLYIKEHTLTWNQFFLYLFLL